MCGKRYLDHGAAVSYGTCAFCLISHPHLPSTLDEFVAFLRHFFWVNFFMKKKKDTENAFVWPSMQTNDMRESLSGF